MVREVLGLVISALLVGAVLFAASYAYAEDRKSFCARHGAILDMSARYNNNLYELETFLKVLGARSKNDPDTLDSQYVTPYIKTAYVTGDVDTVLNIFLKDCMAGK